MESDCNHCHADQSYQSCVSIVPIFNHLEKEQLDEIARSIRPVSYKKGEMIYHAGEKSNTLFIVNKGKMRIYRLSESGKKQVLRILSVGDFTGELALFSESLHESFAEAIEETQVCTINRSDVQALLLKYPAISLAILTELTNRLEQVEKQTTSFATEKVETRIAVFLAEYAMNECHSNVFELPMSKKDLASYLGTTPETVSRKLTEFEKEGYIAQLTHKKIKVVDIDSLLLV